MVPAWGQVLARAWGLELEPERALEPEREPVLEQEPVLVLEPERGQVLVLVPERALEPERGQVLEPVMRGCPTHRSAQSASPHRSLQR